MRLTETVYRSCVEILSCTLVSGFLGFCGAGIYSKRVSEKRKDWREEGLRVLCSILFLSFDLNGLSPWKGRIGFAQFLM